MIVEKTGARLLLLSSRLMSGLRDKGKQAYLERVAAAQSGVGRRDTAVADGEKEHSAHL